MLGELPCRLHWNQAKQGKTAVKPGENLQVAAGKEEVPPPPTAVPAVKLPPGEQPSYSCTSGDGAGEPLRSSAKAWGGWKGRFSFLPPGKRHRKHRRAQAHGEAVETMHLKPELVAQEQDYFLYLSTYENSLWRDLNPRSE